MKKNSKVFLEKTAELMEVSMDELSFEQSLTSYACWDSLTIVSIIGLVDDLFQVEITGVEIESCGTFQVLMDFILSKTHLAAA